jgi:hypothetical protein
MWTDRTSYALTILTCARCPDAARGCNGGTEFGNDGRARQEAVGREEVSSVAHSGHAGLGVLIRLDAISRCRQRDVERTPE